MLNSAVYRMCARDSFQTNRYASGSRSEVRQDPACPGLAAGEDACYAPVCIRPESAAEQGIVAFREVRVYAVRKRI